MILDTNALSDLARNNAALVSLLSTATRLYLPSIALGEYRYGILASHFRRKAEVWLKRVEKEFIPLVVDHDTAQHYAVIRHQLRRAGRPIPENDIWIAALTRQHQLPLATRDAHFKHIEHIEILSW